MPRNGSGVYTRPPGTDGIPDTTIESGRYNTFVGDVETDLNAARPIVAGGTGATSAAAARASIKAEVAAAQVTNYDSHTFETGSFYSLAGATGAPTPNATSGTAVVFDSDPNFITLEARDIVSGLPYGRQKTGGVWGGWTANDAAAKEVSGVQVTNFNTHVFQNGSWWAAASATGAPVTGRAFSGTVHGQDTNNLVVEARDLDWALAVAAWTPSTFYNPGDVRRDTADNTIWRCNTGHLAGATTFAAFRAGLPGVWSPWPTGTRRWFRTRKAGVWDAGWTPE
jgi:hypothetical protein